MKVFEDIFKERYLQEFNWMKSSGEDRPKRIDDDLEYFAREYKMVRARE